MKYPEFCNNIIDVTKPPYNADNTGKTDCTKVLRQILDDVLKGYPEELEKTRQKLLAMSDNLKENAHIGRETGRVQNGEMTITFPEFIPDGMIIYFPKGIYRVSDTITYTLKNVNTMQNPNYKCELCRNIHFLGENKEETIIRLDDNAKGFEKRKSVICFNTAAKEGDARETTNCAMQNTVVDLTVDCGKGNKGAIGIFYVSSNMGRIENVDIKGEDGYCGMYFDIGSEGVFRDIKIKGFDYGFVSPVTCPMILDRVDLSRNKNAGMKMQRGSMVLNDVTSGDIPMFDWGEASTGRFVVCDKTKGIKEMNETICYSHTDNTIDIPKAFWSEDVNDFAFVDDFGAVGDGKTDSARAIQRAMDSGKPIVIFGKGTYHIERTIKIPSTVKLVDFMYGNLSSGMCLTLGELDSAFEICEEAKDVLHIRNLLAHEQFYGFFRMFKHSVRRDVVISDICAIFTPLYFNTVGGSTVYFDNCFITTGSYAQTGIVYVPGYNPVFCDMIPVELHSQKVFANNLNIERANVELLNDNSDLFMNGYKTEGGGTALKSINGGKTKINLINNGIWRNSKIENALYDIEDSAIEMCKALVFLFNNDRRYCTAFSIDGERTNLFDCSELEKEDFRLIDEFKN